MRKKKSSSGFTLLDPGSESRVTTLDKGFTLIELLVVIAVIALLLSIIAPGLRKAKEKARMILCMSNTRQIGYQMTVYNSNYNEYFPLYSDAYLNNEEKKKNNTDRYWPYFIDPSFERFSAVGFPEYFVCPALKNTQPINESNLPYGYNYRIFGNYNSYTPEYARATNFKNPGGIILISESRRWIKAANTIDNTLGLPMITPPVNVSVYTDAQVARTDCAANLAYRHSPEGTELTAAINPMVSDPDNYEPGGKVSVLWLDLHATTENRQQIKDPENVHQWGVRYNQ